MPEEIKQLNDRLLILENRLNGITNDPRQVQVIINALQATLLDVKSVKTVKFGIGTTPIATQASISDPIGGIVIDAEARTAIDSILTVLDSFGLTS